MQKRVSAHTRGLTHKYREFLAVMTIMSFRGYMTGTCYGVTADAWRGRGVA